MIGNLHPLSATLTWNNPNQFAGGAHSRNGLTTLGKECVKILEKKGVLIDTAHLSRSAFYEVAKITTFPIYNSHSNIFSLKRNSRNLTDKQMDLIVESNGFLGVTFYDKFISSKEVSCMDVARQFDYAIKKFGYNNIGIGSDLYGIEPQHLPLDLSGYSQLDNLENALKKLGYDEKVTKKLFYENFQAFLKRVGRG